MFAAGNTALLALVGADPTQPAPADVILFQEMSSLLIANGARINHVNSHMRTALDHIELNSSETAKELAAELKSKGAKSFEDSAKEAEELWNAAVREVLSRGGFGAPTEVEAGPTGKSKVTQAFGGSGGGGTGAKLLGKAEQSLREAAGFLKIYPSAKCWIETPSGPHDKHNLRGKSVLDCLKAAGAANNFECSCLEQKW